MNQQVLEITTEIGEDDQVISRDEKYVMVKSLHPRTCSISPEIGKILGILQVSDPRNRLSGVCQVDRIRAFLGQTFTSAEIEKNFKLTSKYHIYCSLKKNLLAKKKISTRLRTVLCQYILY